MADEPTDGAGGHSREPGDRSPNTYLSERRVLGLLGAAVVATAGYWFVTRIEPLEVVLFFLVFGVVFVALDYAVYRYD